RSWRRRSVPRRDDSVRQTERKSAPVPSCRSSSPLAGRDKAIDGVMPIGVAGREARARKIRPVGRIRPDLRFKADGIRLPVQQPLLSLDRAVEIVSRIDLQAGLICQEFEDPSGSRRFEPGCETQFACTIEAKVVVVAPAVAQLL